MIDLLAPRTRPDPEAVARVRGWVYELFGLPDDTAITVMELACADSDCPDVETVIGVLGEPGKARKHKVLKGLAAVTREDVMSLAARGNHG